MAEQTKMTFGQACARGLSLAVGNPGALLLGTLSESGISILSTCLQMAAVMVIALLAMGTGDGVLDTAVSWKSVSPLAGAAAAVLMLSLLLRGLWTGAAVRRFSTRLESSAKAPADAGQASPDPIVLGGAEVFPRVAFFSAAFLPVLLAAFLVGATGIGGALLVAWEMVSGALSSKWLAAFVIALGTTLSLFVNKGAWMVFKAGLVRVASSGEAPLEAMVSGFRLLARRPFFFVSLFLLFAAAETVALWMADASGAGFATTQETLRSLPAVLIVFLFVTSSVIAAAALVLVNAAEYGALTALSMEEQGRFVFEKPAPKPAPVRVTAPPSPAAGAALPDQQQEQSTGAPESSPADGTGEGEDEIIETVLATAPAPSPTAPAKAEAETEDDIVGTVLAQAPQSPAAASTESAAPAADEAPLSQEPSGGTDSAPSGEETQVPAALPVSQDEQPSEASSSAAADAERQPPSCR